MTNLASCIKPFKAAFLSLSFLALTSTSAFAQVSIDTITGWDGTTFISAFGVVNTATYGQTITVAAGVSPLVNFSFEIGGCNVDVSFRGSVYAWDGTKATGPSLYTSGVQSVTAGPGFTLVTFNVGSLSLPAGNYVLFASTSQDQAGAPAVACKWGTRPDNAAYAGGQMVYLNNGANAAAWTTFAWNLFGRDLAFRVTGLSAAPIPTLSEWGMIILSVLMALSALMVIRRKQV